MLPVEETLLSELRLKSTWQAINRKQIGQFFRTPEARLLFRALERCHQSLNGGGVVPKAQLERLVVGIGEEAHTHPRLTSRLGDPSPPDLSYTIVWRILAGAQILGNHSRALEAAKEGRLEPEHLQMLVEGMESLSRTQGGLPETAPIPLSTWKPKEGEKGERIPTFLHSILDEKLGGGMRRKEVAMICAPTDHGKTTNLLRVATSLAREGLKVFFMSFETPLSIIYERVKTLLGKKPKENFYAQEYDSDALSAKEVTRIAGTIDGLDALFVDHLDLLRFDDFDPINAHGFAIRELRNYARHHDAVVWTAAQADEPSFGQTWLSRGQLYGSRQKLHACALALGCLTFPEREKMTYVVWKTKHARRGLQFMSSADMVRLRFKDIL